MNNRLTTIFFDVKRTARRRRGAVFITALGIIAILSGMLLAFAMDMRTEQLAAANRAAQQQADAIELAAEQYLMAQVDLNATTNANGAPDSWTLVFNTPAEAVQVGNGYFWFIHPDEQTPGTLDYGIVDECSKLNLNATSFTSAEMLNLPTDITEDVADAVQDWKNTAAKASTDGAESDYYNGLSIPYDCKNQPFETVDELQLVRGFGPDEATFQHELYGIDTNRNGALEDAENAAGNGAAAMSASSNDPRGIYRYLTTFSTGETALQTTGGGGGGGGGRGGGGGGGGAAATTTSAIGLVNVNTASEEVFEAMGLTQSQADAVMQAVQAQTGGLTSASMVTQALSGDAAPNGFLAACCDTSYQYSADIVAVSGDGRAFKRVRVVVSCAPGLNASATSTTTTTGGGGGGSSTSTTPTTPSQIIYRRDMTNYGWPLSPDIRKQLRSGQGIEPGTPGSNLGTNGSGTH